MYETSNADLQRTNLTTNKINNNCITVGLDDKDVCGYNQDVGVNHLKISTNVAANLDQVIENQLKGYENEDNNRASFTFEEIGAIIEEFADIAANPIIRRQQHQSYNSNHNGDSATYNYPNSPGEVDRYINDFTQQQIYRPQDTSKSTGTTNVQDIDKIYKEIYQPDCYIYQPEDTYNESNTMANNRNKNYLFNNLDEKSKPYVEIVEQPAKCSLRFRYKCEGRSAGSLSGQQSTVDNKSFPSIRIANYVGRAVVVISCVTKDAPYKAHPHNIVGKEGCKKGICTIVINNEANTVRSFSSLGIQCVKRKDVEESLTLRESINVDPFRNGFGHKLNPSNIDLNVVRLCFQVFIEGLTPNKCDVPLTPVVSDPIHDKKAMSDLVITKLSHCSAPATGGREVILLCDRISKDDIQIRFYEERDGKIIWETYTELSPNDVHKQVAICFKTPKYYNENITQPVMVRIQLKRTSDNQVSEPRLFQFLPCESDEDIISRKRQKIEWVNTNHYALDSILQPHNHIMRQPQVALDQPAPVAQQASSHTLRQPQLQHANERLEANCIIPDNNRNHHEHYQVHNIQVNQTIGAPALNAAQNHPDQGRNMTQVGSTNKTPNLNIANDLSQSPSIQHQHGEQYISNTHNLVVRREIIDNEGKVMRLVDRPSDLQQQQQQLLQDQQQNQGAGQVPLSKPLGSSLDRIDTAELMRDMAFNSTIDFNLGSCLSLHLNGGETMHEDSQGQNYTNRAKENCNGKVNKD